MTRLTACRLGGPTRSRPNPGSRDHISLQSGRRPLNPDGGRIGALHVLVLLLPQLSGAGGNRAKIEGRDQRALDT